MVQPIEVDVKVTGVEDSTKELTKLRREFKRLGFVAFGIADVTPKLKARFEDINKIMGDLTKKTQRFRAEMLSIMFGAMSIQRTLQRIGTTSIAEFKRATEATHFWNTAIGRLGLGFSFIKIALGEAINTALGPFSQWLIDNLDNILDFISKNDKLIGQLIVFGSILAGLVVAGGSLTLFIDGLKMAGLKLEHLQKLAATAILVKMALDLTKFLEDKELSIEELKKLGESIALLGAIKGSPWMIVIGLAIRLFPAQTQKILALIGVRLKRLALDVEVFWLGVLNQIKIAALRLKNVFEDVSDEIKAAQKEFKKLEADYRARRAQLVEEEAGILGVTPEEVSKTVMTFSEIGRILSGNNLETNRWLSAMERINKASEELSVNLIEAQGEIGRLRFSSLQVSPLPGRQFGGVIPATGLYKMHAGEYVVNPSFSSSVTVNTGPISSQIDVHNVARKVSDTIMRDVKRYISPVSQFG